MRQIHFVGTVPASGVAQAMALMLDVAYPNLRSIPDGENTDDRDNWVVGEIERRAEIEGLTTLRRSRMREPGRLRPLLHPPIYAKRPGYAAVDIIEKINTGHADRAVLASAVLQQLAAERGISRPPQLQVDIPGPLNLAAFSTGPFMLRYYDYEVQSLLREIWEIHKRLSGKVVYHLSIPFETHLIAHTPRVAAPLMRRLCEFVRQTPDGSAFIVHWCLGDKDGMPITKIENMEPLTHATNELFYNWPHSTHILDGVHLPCGDGMHAAPASAAYYWSLRKLALPSEVRLIAGLASVLPTASLDRQLAALNAIEATARRKVVISSPCGWGGAARGRIHLVDALSRRTAELAAAPRPVPWSARD